MGRVVQKVGIAPWESVCIIVVFLQLGGLYLSALDNK